MRFVPWLVLYAGCAGETGKPSGETGTYTFETDTDTDADSDSDTDSDTDTDTDSDTDPSTPDTLLVSFEEATAPVLTGFGAETGSIVVDPTDATNHVGQLDKPDTAELWAGTTISYCPADGIAVLPFSATVTTLWVDVWSPDAGIPVRLKVEDSTDSTVSVETEATVTTANAWNRLVFDFANPAPDTAALDLAKTYDKVSIFPNFGVAGADAGAKTYYVDALTFVGAAFSPDCPAVTTTTGTPETLPITFGNANTTYTLTGFGGAEDSAVEPDPDDATNEVARVTKSATAEDWAGTTFSTLPNNQVTTQPLTATALKMQLRVRSPRAGVPVRLKVEDAADATHSVETEALTTGVDTWETLTFDFGAQAAGTAAWDATYVYDRASVFFDFGTTGAAGGDGTFYFDDFDLAP